MNEREIHLKLSCHQKKTEIFDEKFHLYSQRIILTEDELDKGFYFCYSFFTSTYIFIFSRVCAALTWSNARQREREEKCKRNTTMWYNMMQFHFYVTNQNYHGALASLHTNSDAMNEIDNRIHREGMAHASEDWLCVMALLQHQ